MEKTTPPAGSPGPDERPELSTEDRRRVALAAARRPLHLLVLVAGLGMFAATLTAWILPLTLVTYVALIALSSRDEVFQRTVLEGRPVRGLPEPGGDASPERRARWLTRGETRQRVEAALEVQRSTIKAIEEADDVTREVLPDAVPRLRELAESLVSLAHRREQAESEARRLEAGSRGSTGLREDIRHLDAEVERADDELAGMVERLLALRAKVVRVSLESGDPARQAAENLMRELDGLNHRLDALAETQEPPSDAGRGP